LRSMEDALAPICAGGGDGHVGCPPFRHEFCLLPPQPSGTIGLP
jgi:hypothetical protein